jgi:hypothetical protein
MRQTKIIVRRYDLDEFLEDMHGSRAAVKMTSRAALACLDETALFDIRLRTAAQSLVATARAAIVSISPCDPAHLAMRELLSETSFLRARWSTAFKPNSIHSASSRSTAKTACCGGYAAQFRRYC